MSIATNESILEAAATDSAIAEAEAEYAASGKLHDAKEALRALRRKHFRISHPCMELHSSKDTS